MLRHILNSVFNLNAFKKPSPDELIDAAGRGDLDTAKQLYECGIIGVDLNGTNKDKETALMRAAARGYTEFVDWLISNLADVSATDKYGRTAKDIAKKTLHMGIVKSLEKAGEVQYKLMAEQAIKWHIRPPMSNF